MDATTVASQFESLGGGGLNVNGWAFGCEFGFFQRHVGIEPMGLLRWASIGSDDLRRGIEAGFVGVDDPAAIELREHTGWEWGITQTTYGMHLDHSGMARTETPRERAISQMARNLGFLRRKLLEELGSGERLFVYRTYDHALTDEALDALSAAMRTFPLATLFYVRHAADGHPAFTAERRDANLIVGYIDRFAPQPGRLDYNHAGWESVCRAALDVRRVQVTCQWT